MNQSKVSTFVFAVASLAGILCVSKTDGQVYGFPPSSPQHRSFPIPSSDSQPISITLGPDGNFWFTEQNHSQVARITPQGVITEFLTPTFSFPIGITAGPDGNIWFTELIANKIWRLELPSRNLTSFPIPTENSSPNDIIVGADGNLWFTEGGGGKIGRITTSGVITEFGSGLTLPFSIANGPDGNIWFTQRFTQQIGKITPTGQFTFYPIPSTAEQIAPGFGNNLLFTEFGSNRVAKITTDGVVTESPEIPNSGPTGIVTGPSRQVWFLGYASNRVYRIACSH